MLTPEELMYSVIEALTGGLAHDMETVIYGCFSLMIVVAGFAKITQVIGLFSQNRQFEAAYGAAREFHTMRDSAERGTVEYDYYNAQYRRALSAGIRANPAGAIPLSQYEAGVGEDPFHVAPNLATPGLAYDPGSDPGYYGYDFNDPGPSRPPRGF